MRRPPAGYLLAIPLAAWTSAWSVGGPAGRRALLLLPSGTSVATPRRRGGRPGPAAVGRGRCAPAFDSCGGRTSHPRRTRPRRPLGGWTTRHTQKPQCVIDRLAYFLRARDSNIHTGGAHPGRRRPILIGRRPWPLPRAGSPTRWCSSGSDRGHQPGGQRGDSTRRAGDEILISHLEHHATSCPGRCWPADRRRPEVIGGRLRPAAARRVHVAAGRAHQARRGGPRIQRVGTVTPVDEIVALATGSARVLVDGASRCRHTDRRPADGCGLLRVLRAQIFGPTGIGCCTAGRRSSRTCRRGRARNMIRT